MRIHERKLQMREPGSQTILQRCLWIGGDLKEHYRPSLPRSLIPQGRGSILNFTITQPYRWHAFHPDLIVTGLLALTIQQWDRIQRKLNTGSSILRRFRLNLDAPLPQEGTNWVSRVKYTVTKTTIRYTYTGKRVPKWDKTTKPSQTTNQYMK